MLVQRYLLLAVLAIVSLGFGLVSGTWRVHAQDGGLGASYITPFPDGDIYQTWVVGDSLADGLHGVFRDTLARDARLQINRQRWTFNSVTRSGFARELGELKRDLRNDKVNIVVMMIGTYDRRSIRNRNGERIRLGTPEWRQEYSRRVGGLMKVFKDLNIAVYWVGLPNMRRLETNETARKINEIVRERAYLNGLKYVDAFTRFADEQGGYSAYGPDLTGQIRLLRERDGVHLTYEGSRKLAHFVERQLKRDLKLAKAERSIPLAGSEKEQTRINPKTTAKSEPATETGWRAAIQGGKTSDKAGKKGGESRGFFGRGRGGEQKTDDGRITLKSYDNTGAEETVTLEILRPAIPASVVALVTRKQSPDRLSQNGDTLVDQIAGGLNIMSSVTPAHEVLGGGAARRLSPAQTPFFRVLVKGERTAAKPGRADDFSWPRPDLPPLPPEVIKLKPAKGGAGRGGGGMPLPPVSPFRRRV